MYSCLYIAWPSHLRVCHVRLAAVGSSGHTHMCVYTHIHISISIYIYLSSYISDNPPPSLIQGVSCTPGGGWELWKPSVACVTHWYTTGAVALLNALVGDLFAILLLIEFVMHGGPGRAQLYHDL